MQRFSKSLAVLSAAAKAGYFGLRSTPLSYWDVGARWGLSRPVEILYRLGFVRPIFFDPDPSEANKLMAKYKSCKVFNYALGNTNGEGVLYVTRDPGSSSLLRPLVNAEIVTTCSVPIVRGETLLQTIPRELHPEIIKLDIQGSELSALQGFGNMLDNVICIEAEISFQRSYDSQPLAEEITGFLMNHGFGLLDLKVFGVRSTRAATQANAFYSRRTLRTAREAGVETVFRALNRISLAP